VEAGEAEVIVAAYFERATVAPGRGAERVSVELFVA
jgi:hypothetical protein